MSLFKINYDKPGRGVEKDEPEKSLPAKFFLIFFRRLSKFSKTNLIFMIPTAVICALMVLIFIMPGQRFVMELSLPTSVVTLQLWELYVVPVPLILLSPFYGGLMVVARRMANEEYVFPWSEYWKGVKDNWKQFLINGIVCYVAYVVLSFAIVYYYNQTAESWVNYIPLALVFMLMIIVLLAQLYVPLLIVSVELKLIPIYKNALIFGIMGLFRNILNILIIGVVLFLYLYIMPIMGLTVLIGAALFVFILPAFLAYANAFICYPMIDNYIVKPFVKKEEVKNDPQVQTSTQNFIYESDELDDNAPEYVYLDGKLVKKTDIDK